MMPCKRSCCWTPFGCANARSCGCHYWEQYPTTVKGGADRTYRDPTAAEAIGNVMKDRRGR